MDYLVSEGYPLAAQKFAAEANMHSPLDVDSIQERVDIRMAIDSGDIQAAIEKINEFNPQVSILSSEEDVFSELPAIAMIRPCSCTTHNLSGH